MPNSICVIGWHFVPEVYSMFAKLRGKYDVHVVAHRPDFMLMGNTVKFSLVPNVGLEFGGYDYFIKCVWRKGNVLFIHDDINVCDISVFDRIFELKHDQAYIFNSEQDSKNNGGKHGRAIYLSEKCIKAMLSHWRTNIHSQAYHCKHRGGRVIPGTGPYNGFWVDKENTGHTGGEPPENVRHYNEMIYSFHTDMGLIRDGKLGERLDVVNRCYFPEITLLRRGK